jgi:hypothetical protein
MKYYIDALFFNNILGKKRKMENGRKNKKIWQTRII